MIYDLLVIEVFDFGPSANTLFPQHYVWHGVNDLPVPVLFKLRQ